MSVKNKTNKNYKRSQKGRSMVEMLGVLAIIGVLSVGGLYGYGVAMKKHKANELLHQASMLATTISAQAMTNNGTLPTTITDFGNSGYDTDLTDNGTKFILTMKDVDSAVCNQLKTGGMIQKVECKEGTSEGKMNAEITYYKNLATTEAEGEKSPTGGSSNSFNPNGPTGDEDGADCSGDRPGECSVCRKTYVDETSGAWYDSDALCTTPGQTCVDGSCVTTAAETPTFTGNMCKCIYIEAWEDTFCGGDEYSCNCYDTDANCAQYGTWDATQEKCVIETFCTNNGDCASDEYCHYTSMGGSTCQPNKKGTCMAKADAKGTFASGTTAEEDGFIRSSGTMDWFSAQNFCRSYGKNLVTLEQMGLGNVVPSGQYSCYGTGTYACNIDADGWLAIQAKFGSDFSPWTANLVSGSSCNAFRVSLGYSSADMSGNGRHGRSDALCR